MTFLPHATQADREFAVGLVRAGAVIAARVQASGLHAAIRSKSGRTDVVTVADTTVESAWLEALRAQRPADGVLGEEGAVHRSESGRTWVLDPVDGTYNFSRGGDRWCAAIALEVAGTPVLGAVAAGGGGAVVSGGQDLGVWLDDTPLGPIQDRPLGEACVATYLHPGRHEGAEGAAWRRVVEGAATLRMTGSGSMDARDLVLGKVDLVIQHSVPVWDSSPGAAMVLELGGLATRVEAGGVEWYVAGAPTAVGEAVTLLLGG